MARGLFYLLVTLQITAIIANDLDWWKSSVIYQIYTRSFKDTDGNGIGDLQGIIQNVNYLKSLGIDAVWLTPIYPTEDKDFGYDITNMKDVYQIFGDMETFDTLVKTLHDAGLKLLLDFVPNHTSNKHPWFIKSVNEDDKYKEYYVWRNGKTDESGDMIPPNNWVSGISGGSAWKYNDQRKQYYLHQFLEEQPDLNYSKEEVLAQMKDVLCFWLEKGVDGFRMDAVYALCEDPLFLDDTVKDGKILHDKTFDQPQTFEVLKSFRKTLDEYTAKDNKTRLMMVENYNNDPKVIKKYYSDDDGHPIAHFPFNFFIIMKMNLESDAGAWANITNLWYNVMGKDNYPNWVLGNHDQRRVASRFSQEYVDLLNILILSLKGTVVTYFGEEIGMPDSLVRMDQAKDPQGKNVSYAQFLSQSRDPERGPFLWNASATAGFSSSLNPWLPISTSYWKINVETQNKTIPSHLSIYRDMITLRKNYTLKHGDIEIVNVTQNVLVVYRFVIDNPTLATVINFGNHEEKVDLKKHRATLPDKLFAYTSSLNIDHKNNSIIYDSSEVKLPPKSALVLLTSA